MRENILNLYFQNNRSYISKYKKLFKRIQIDYKYASFLSINRILLMHNNLDNNNLKKIF